ncbi:MAG: rane-associated protein, partial [Pseudonocardiales bacterium]|nr:rane-associated protein [Pseudonocardiales bacterium]
MTVLAAGFLDDYLGDAGPAAIWAVVLVFVFLECAFVLGLFLPGDSLLFA